MASAKRTDYTDVSAMADLVGDSEAPPTGRVAAVDFHAVEYEISKKAGENTGSFGFMVVTRSCDGFYHHDALRVDPQLLLRRTSAELEQCVISEVMPTDGGGFEVGTTSCACPLLEVAKGPFEHNTGGTFATGACKIFVPKSVAQVVIKQLLLGFHVASVDLPESASVMWRAMVSVAINESHKALCQPLPFVKTVCELAKKKDKRILPFVVPGAGLEGDYFKNRVILGISGMDAGDFESMLGEEASGRFGCLYAGVNDQMPAAVIGNKRLVGEPCDRTALVKVMVSGADISLLESEVAPLYPVFCRLLKGPESSARISITYTSGVLRFVSESSYSISIKVPFLALSPITARLKALHEICERAPLAARLDNGSVVEFTLSGKQGAEVRKQLMAIGWEVGKSRSGTGAGAAADELRESMARLQSTVEAQADMVSQLECELRDVCSSVSGVATVVSLVESKVAENQSRTEAGIMGVAAQNQMGHQGARVLAEAAGPAVVAAFDALGQMPSPRVVVRQLESHAPTNFEVTAAATTTAKPAAGEQGSGASIGTARAPMDTEAPTPPQKTGRGRGKGSPWARGKGSPGKGGRGKDTAAARSESSA